MVFFKLQDCTWVIYKELARITHVLFVIRPSSKLVTFFSYTSSIGGLNCTQDVGLFRLVAYPANANNSIFRTKGIESGVLPARDRFLRPRRS